MVNIALVGCAHIHTPNFVQRLNKRREENGDIAVTAVWDPESARAEKRAADLKAPVVGDLSAIWSDVSINAVVICSETTMHEPLVEAATTAKKHLFVEKPLGMGSTDGYRMARSIEKAGVIFQTGYFMRSDPKHQFIKQQIEEGAFGKITRARGSNCHGGALGGWFDSKPQNPADDWRWMADPARSGVGGFGDLGTHPLDILLWLLGDVTSATAQIDNGTARYANCDETGEGLMRFSNGAIGSLAAGWDDLANPMSLLISGTEACAAIVRNELYFQSKQVADADGKQPWKDLPAARPHAFDLFLDAITGENAVPLVNPVEAAYRSAVMEAMYEGARKSAWVAPRVG